MKDEGVHRQARQRLLIVTTVPETLAVILQGQPQFLNQHFDVALATSQGPELDALMSEGVPVHVVNMARGINPIKDLVSIWNMVRLLRCVRPDVVHSFTPKAGLVAMLAGWFCKVPVHVHTFTGLIWPTAKGWRQKLLMMVDRLLCDCATHVLPEGQGVKLDMLRGKITHKPLQVIGYGNIAGVDAAHFSRAAHGLAMLADELRENIGIQTHDFVYAFVGRMNRDKGLDELLAAFMALPNNCRLLIVGAVDHVSPISAQAMDLLQNHQRVHWLGFQHDIRPALMLAHVLVLPSYREGLPNVLLQAGAMALPAIATDIGGCNDVIEQGLNGWLVQPADALSLQNAMQSACDATPQERCSMGQVARARILERFERHGHWRRMLAFYRALGLPTESRVSNKKFLLVAGLAESILNFRADLLRSLQDKGFEIHVAAPKALHDQALLRQLCSQGWHVHDIPLNRVGKNPFRDIYTVWSLWKTMRQIRPDYVLPYTIKPVIYATLAAWLAGVPHRFALITGVGYAFTARRAEGLRGWIKIVVQMLYKFALKRVNKLFFQNIDDQALFMHMGLLPAHTPSMVINGSGVNLTSFSTVELPLGPPHFLLIARLLGDKGVREYTQAAQRIKALHPHVRFSMAGWLDENPDAIAQAELDGWLADGSIEFLGRLADVRPAIAACSVYVLPSYREGMPRTVLEAMAMGRAIITTDAPGCRETVVHGDNGFLVPVQDAEALAQAMQRFIDEPSLQQTMGARSRQMAEDRYDVHKVNAVMLAGMGVE